MFYHLFYPLKDSISAFNVFRYITFRSVGASITAFLVCLLLGPAVTRLLQRLSAVASVRREHAPSIHKYYEHKKSVPTMGGILILIGIIGAALLWGDLSNRLFLLCVGTVIWFGVIGFFDDFLKIRDGNSKGLQALTKLLGQVVWGLLIGVYLYRDPQFTGVLHIPFLKETVLCLGVLYIPFVILVLAGTSNALNLTDGLDGLAIGCLIFAAGAFAIMSYVSGHALFADYLNIPHIREAGELTVFCAALIGAGTGFLWYNSYPATVFMGDTGSLPLGAALGAVAVCIQKELVLPIVGGVFVWEALSVILQVASYKLTGKRIFRMAPFHHHLQLRGWPESKVTIRLWIIAFVLALAGLATLKLR